MKGWALLGAINGFLGVALGAFGAHWIRRRRNAKAVELFQTAARYQVLHAIALIAVAYFLEFVVVAQGAAIIAGWAFLAGIVLFSGSLYGLALTGNKDVGRLAPVGGVAFLVGWAALVIAAILG